MLSLSLGVSTPTSAHRKPLVGVQKNMPSRMIGLGQVCCDRQRSTSAPAASPGQRLPSLFADSAKILIICRALFPNDETNRTEKAATSKA